MNHLKSLRCQMALPQEDFARLLGVSRSMLALAETGRRNLPAAALQLVANLQTIQRQCATQTPKPSAVFHIQTHEVSERLLNCRQEKYRLEKRLQKMEMKFRCNELLAGMMEGINKHCINGRQQRYAESLGQMATTNMKSCCPASRQLLYIRLQALDVEIGLLEGIEEVFHP